MLHISRHFLTVNNWYLHLLVYYKYMLNFQWGLFCRLGFGVTFSNFCVSNLTWIFSSHDLFVLFQRCFGVHFWHFCKFFTCHYDLVLCMSKIYHVFNSLYVDYHNLNVRCIETKLLQWFLHAWRRNCTYINMAIKLNYKH